MNQMTPREIVNALDRYIIGQDEAKRAVAIALRNRYRRSMLPSDIQEEIIPKNIIMMGPTGCGKTEIARRLAKLVQAPFVKVEATKFTEVGYVGRDVESMVRDLVEASVRIVRNQRMEAVKNEAARAAENRLVDILSNAPKQDETPQAGNPFQMLLQGAQGYQNQQPKLSPEELERLKGRKREVRENLRAGYMEDILLDIEVTDNSQGVELTPGATVELNLQDMMGLPPKKKKRRCPVREARKLLEQEEAAKLIDNDSVNDEAVELAEKQGIIFIDEIVKITGKNDGGSGPDISREGVQRDILPLVEGTTVTTKYGPVKTDYILFIASGAFHVARVSDLMPELQGRFPIRVELHSLTQEDFKRILSQTENAITKQYAALLSVDNVNVTFTGDALDEMAAFAYAANETGENIGARRLHTIMETLLEDISFNANGNHPIINLEVNRQYVREHLSEMDALMDMHRYIL